MDLPEYLHKFPLTRSSYDRAAVQIIRKHAFLAGHPAKRMTRSEKQNRYYWGIVLKIMSLETGYTKDEMHQELGEKFRAYEAHGRTFIRSTTDYNTLEMEEYLATVRRFASMALNIYIPLPNETEFAYDVPNIETGA